MSRGDGHDNVPIDNPEGAILNFLEFRYWTITIAKEDTVTVEANRLNHMEWAIWGLMGHRIRDSNFTSFIAFLCVLSLCSMWFKNLSIFTPRYSYDSSSFTATLLNTMFEFRALYNFFEVPNKTYSFFSCLRFTWQVCIYPTNLQGLKDQTLNMTEYDSQTTNRETQVKT